MTQPKRCELTWCTAPHDSDTTRIAHHHNHLGEYRAQSATIDVVARWAERLDGRPSINPHISIFMDTAGDTHVTDLTPREARIWASQLQALNGSPWLVEKLRAAADLLHEWEVDEFDGVPHRVAEPPTDAREASLFALRTATFAARRILQESERFPVAAMEAMDLTRWLGEYRSVVAHLVKAIDMAEAQGVLA